MKWMPLQLFFGPEKKSRDKKYIHHLKRFNCQKIAEQQEINAVAMSFYEKLYQAESCEEAVVNEFLCDLPSSFRSR